MSKAKFFVLVASVAAVPFGSTASLAQQPPPQSPNMTFFVASTGPGKGADLGGLEGADRQCQTLAQGGGRGRQDLARLSQHPGGGRRAGRQCARPHRTRPLAEFQRRGRRPKRRRSPQRQQQARHADVADRAGHHGRGRRLHAQLSRRSDRLADGRAGVSAWRGQNLPQLDEQHPRRGHGRPHRPQGVCAMMPRRSRGIRRIPRAGPTAAAARTISEAPAATACSTASPRTSWCGPREAAPRMLSAQVRAASARAAPALSFVPRAATSDGDFFSVQVFGVPVRRFAYRLRGQNRSRRCLAGPKTPQTYRRRW